MKLGGWLRIWVVVTVLYGCVVLVVAYSQRPTLEQLQYNWVRDAADVAATILSKSNGQQLSGSEVRNRWVRDRTDAEVIKTLAQIESAPSETQKPYSTEVGKVNAKHRQLASQLSAEIASHIGLSLVWWLGPSLVLLALGWAVGWVVRGFRSSRA